MGEDPRHARRSNFELGFCIDIDHSAVQGPAFAKKKAGEGQRIP